MPKKTPGGRSWHFYSITYTPPRLPKPRCNWHLSPLGRHYTHLLSSTTPNLLAPPSNNAFICTSVLYLMVILDSWLIIRSDWRMAGLLQITLIPHSGSVFIVQGCTKWQCIEFSLPLCGNTELFGMKSIAGSCRSVLSKRGISCHFIIQHILRHSLYLF